jgi:hypothetical protein
MVTRWRLGAEQRAVLLLLRRIPPTAAVSANERLVPHLATRREIHVFPLGVERSEWIIGLTSEVLTRVPPGFVEVERAGGMVLLRRASS